MSDETGHWPLWAKKLVAAGAVKGAAIGFAVGAASGAAIGYVTTGILEGTLNGTTQELGHWVSPNNYGSSARSLLALPSGNTMTNTSSFLLQKGSTVLTGKAAPLFGQSGGGVQWWISALR